MSPSSVQAHLGDSVDVIALAWGFRSLALRHSCCLVSCFEAAGDKCGISFCLSQ